MIMTKLNDGEGFTFSDAYTDMMSKKCNVAMKDALATFESQHEHNRDMQMKEAEEAKRDALKALDEEKESDDKGQETLTNDEASSVLPFFVQPHDQLRSNLIEFASEAEKQFVAATSGVDADIVETTRVDLKTCLIGTDELIEESEEIGGRMKVLLDANREMSRKQCESVYKCCLLQLNVEYTSTDEFVKGVSTFHSTYEAEATLPYKHITNKELVHTYDAVCSSVELTLKLTDKEKERLALLAEKVQLEQKVSQNADELKSSQQLLATQKEEAAATLASTKRVNEQKIEDAKVQADAMLATKTAQIEDAKKANNEALEKALQDQFDKLKVENATNLTQQRTEHNRQYDRMEARFEQANMRGGGGGGYGRRRGNGEREIFTGPKGGRFYINGNGNKTYCKR
jgi:colicin import membrane protein